MSAAGLNAPSQRPAVPSGLWAGACLWGPLVLCLGFAPWPEAGALSGSGLAAGQVWCLWTGHCVHYNGFHLAFDAMALLLTSLAVQRSLGCRPLGQFALLGLPLLSGLILLTAPGLLEYRGASAWAVALGAMAGTALWQQPRLRPWIATAAMLYAYHVAGQIWPHLAVSPLNPLTTPPDVRVLWQAHLAGAALGGLWARWSLRR